MSTTILECLNNSPATSNELQRATGLSQPAVSRQLNSMGGRVIKLRDGRGFRYYLTSNAFGADDRLPLYMVDPHGNNAIVAYVRPLASGGFFLQPCTGMPSVLLGDKRNGLFDDLPYFLDDLRPQGFLGRQIAEQISNISHEFPADPRRWSVDHVGRYLISNGDDLPGNFKFGQQAHLRVRRSHSVVTPDDYHRYADEVMQGMVPGSSAGGEQPKFTAYTAERGHVIVKFSPPKHEALGRRWRDILLTEFHAVESIRAWDFPAAETRIFEQEGRLFLESQRFDRSGEFGRLPLVSLMAVDNEFIGSGSTWPTVMSALERRNLVSWQHVFDAEFLWCFGRLINNTDMHLGNLSLSIDGDVFRILPIYDMCSMGFTPRGGEVPPFSFLPPTLDGDVLVLQRKALESVKEMAHSFWERVSADPRISVEFKEFLKNGNPIDQLLPQRPSQMTLWKGEN